MITKLVDRFTNYHSRCGYPLYEACRAEIMWRLEHTRLDGVLRRVTGQSAYMRRKDWERRGFKRGTGIPGR